MPVATINGENFVAHSPVGWTLTRGTSSIIVQLETDAAVISAGVGDNTTITLRVGTFEAEGVIVIGVTAGQRPETRTLTLGDVRMRWAREYVSRSFNMRRRTGDRRLVGEGVLVAREIVPDVDYAGWSLNEGSLWTPEEILLSVLEDDLQTEFVVEVQIPDYKIQDLVIQGTGSEALAQVLGVLNLDVWVDQKQVAHVFDPRDGTELEQIAVDTAGPALRGRGYHAVADYQKWRPERVVVLYEREVEVRFDFDSEDRFANQSPISGGDTSIPGRVLLNVVPVPDLVLTAGSRQVTLGTWLEVNEAMDAWNIQDPPERGFKYDEESIRKLWAGQWGKFRMDYGTDKGARPILIQQRRCSTLRRHWRQTFRIFKPWMDVFESIRAMRAAIVDTETGQRAPAQAFGDYSVKFTLHGLSKTKSDYHRLGINVLGYNDKLDAATQMPADINVIDPEAGIVRVFLVGDPIGESESIIPGTIAEKDIPSHKALEVASQWTTAPLQEAWKFALVITVIPGAPNNTDRLERVEMSVMDAADVVTFDIGEEGKGPALEVRIPASLLTARYAWLDSSAKAMEQALFQDGPYPEETLTNQDELDEVARIQAAQVYSEFVERGIGSFAVPLNPALRIQGTIESITHSINTRAEATSRIRMTIPDAPIDRNALFRNPAVEAVVRRLVQP